MSRNFGIHTSRFAPVSSISSASAGATGRDSQVAPAQIQTVRPALGGIKPRASRHPADTHRNSISLHPLPSRSIATASAPLERLNLSETVKDIAALAFTFLFLGSVSVLFAASMVLLFLVELH